MTNTDDKREVASDTVTARVTPSTKEEYERILSEMPGESKTEKFKSLIKAVGEANALAAKSGDDRSDYEAFLLHTTRLAEIFDALLKKKSELKDQIYLEFQAQIQSKDKMILDLQDQNEDLISLCKDRESKISEMTPIVEEVKRYQAERDKAIADADKAIADADQLKSKLTDTIAAQSVQIKELQEDLVDLPEIELAKSKMERENEKLSKYLNERTTEITSLKSNVSELETKLKSEKEEREKERAELLMKMSRASEDALRDKDNAIQEARKDERGFWQKQADKIQTKLDAERDKHVQEHTELEEMKMQKRLEIDPKIATLEETIKKLEEELEQTKEQLKKQEVQEDQKEMS